MTEGTTPQEPSKKRKRTGKQREEAKKAAIQAKLDAEAQQQDEATTAEAHKVDEEKLKDDEDVAEVPSGPDFDKIATRVPQALKTLHPTFKQSKRFEVQRLVKKIKFLRSKDGSKDEIADLEAQLAMISHITIDPIIQAHLRIKLSKHPLLKHHPLPSNIVSLLTPKDDQPSTSESQKTKAKVENRLCSSKVVAEAVKTVVPWTLGEEGAKLVKGKPLAKTESATPKGNAKQVGKRSKVEDVDEDEGETADDESEDGLAVPKPRKGEEAEDSNDDLAQEDIAADEAGWESGSVSDTNEGHPRLAPASDDDDDDDDDDDEEQSDESEGSSVAIPTKKTKTKSTAAKSTKESNKAVTSSTFLPSLSHGFVLGDSDSDPDLDPDVDGAGIVGRKGAERKNRRGQRARQAIWEKKYGKNAKHVVKAKEAEKTKEREKKFGPSDKGWRSKTATASAGDSTRPVATSSPAGRGGRGGFAGARTGGREVPVAAAPVARPAAPPAAAAGGALHPSWEAARLRKQREMGGAGAPKAQKIVFD